MNFEDLMKVIEDEVNKIDYNSDIMILTKNTINIMNFEDLMKVIEDEVNKIDYNSDIILTNETTHQRQIIPKNTPTPTPETKPTNFFDIPLDIRKIIYNKTRQLKRIEKYELLSNLKKRKVSIEYFFKKRDDNNNNIGFIDSDDDEETETQETEKETEKECEKKLENLLKKIKEDKDILKERIISRQNENRYHNKKIKSIIITYIFFSDKRKKSIDHIITKEILNNDYNLLKHKNNHSFELYRDTRDRLNYDISLIEDDVSFIDYLQLYKKEFGDDEELKKFEDEYNEIKNDFVDSYGEMLRRDYDKKRLNEKIKKLFFEKMVR